MIPVDFLLNLLNNAAEFSRTGNDLARSLDRAPSERSSGMLGPIFNLSKFPKYHWIRMPISKVVVVCIADLSFLR